MAANVTVPTTMANGAAQDATQVMANYNALLVWLNTNAVLLDGSKAMTANLQRAADPVSANDYARKSYVDTGDLAGPRNGFQATTSFVVPLSGVNYDILWSAETYDPFGQIDNISTDCLIASGQGGTYLASFAMSTPNKNFEFTFYKNAVKLGMIGIAGVESDVTSFVTGAYTLSCVVNASAGDSLWLSVYNVGGGPQTITGTWTMTRIGN